LFLRLLHSCILYVFYVQVIVLCLLCLFIFDVFYVKVLHGFTSFMVSSILLFLCLSPSCISLFVMPICEHPLGIAGQTSRQMQLFFFRILRRQEEVWLSEVVRISICFELMGVYNEMIHVYTRRVHACVYI
jgi:hypothetical protein